MLVIAQQGGGVGAGLCAALAAYADHIMVTVKVTRKIRFIFASIGSCDKRDRHAATLRLFRSPGNRIDVMLSAARSISHFKLLRVEILRLRLRMTLRHRFATEKELKTSLRRRTIDFDLLRIIAFAPFIHLLAIIRR
jgi:hypothetical protein